MINNTRVVSDDVRQRVPAIIDEMRYIPSADYDDIDAASYATPPLTIEQSIERIRGAEIPLRSTAR